MVGAGLGGLHIVIILRGFECTGLECPAFCNCAELIWGDPLEFVAALIAGLRRVVRVSCFGLFALAFAQEGRIAALTARRPGAMEIATRATFDEAEFGCSEG
mmetsp:Transcript_38086/g.85311  ORF Transcript_38086/g.85311 Transcript_38086/m.85311 type:complete len:102 (-) Transcript_38086:388-693(-)